MKSIAWMSSISCFLMLSSALSASQASSNSAREPSFEVASVRQNTTGDTRTSSSPGLMPNPFGRVTPRPGLVTISNMSLKDLIAVAYGINPSLVLQLITGGPQRILATRFDIVARPPEGAPASETLPMLRALLADRFKLRVHFERRDRPVYALVMARQGEFGRRLQPSDIDCTVPGTPNDAAALSPTPSRADGRPVCRRNVYEFGKPGSGDITMSDISPLRSLIVRIQSFVDRPLIDATGLTGSFEWSVSFATSAESTSAPVIYTALQEQLGIRAERRTAPFEVLVIDSVEMPTLN